MGAVCGKSKHFDGEGQRLGSGPSTPARTSYNGRPQPLGNISNTAGNSGGGGGGAKPGGNGEPGGRQAAAHAAEARAKAAAARGTGNVGAKSGLSDQLTKQKRDGGRAEEAVEAGRRGGDEEPLRWD